MKTPTWAIVVGILMLLFGGCGMLQDVQMINVRKMEKVRKEIVNEMDRQEKVQYTDTVVTYSSDSTDTARTVTTTTTGRGVPPESREAIKKMFHISEHAKTWIERFGWIGLFVSVIYLLGGLFLLLKKRFAPGWAYTALILSIALGITKAVVLSGDRGSGIAGIITGFTQVFSIVIDIVLLIIIAVSSKEVFRQQPR